MSDSQKPTLVVLQPSYLPWLGFFDQMSRSDIFVFYDDVQFDKNGWRNRNRIKSPAGPRWLTIPVRVASLNQRIYETDIDNRQAWARKHIGTIKQFYAKAPFLNRYLPELEELLMRRWDRLVDVDISTIELLGKWLGLRRKTSRSSELGIQGERSERLVNMSSHFGVRNYLSGNSAQSYLKEELFTSSKITVEWQNYKHPTYPQQHGEFVPFMSTLDLLLNCGEDSIEIIKRGSKTGII